MHECELKDSCPFFQGKLKSDKDQDETMKEKYCLTNNLNCARYMVFTARGAESIPEDLFPHQKDRAYECLIQE